MRSPVTDVLLSALRSAESSDREKFALSEVLPSEDEVVDPDDLSAAMRILGGVSQCYEVRSKAAQLGRLREAHALASAQAAQALLRHHGRTLKRWWTT